MRIIKVTLIILLSLAIAAVLMWGIFYYLVWPKPEILGLVPGAPLAYIAASNLDETLSAVEGSEFIHRVARSPLWRGFKSSRLWRQMRLQKRVWERQMGVSIEAKGIIQLTGKDAILAFYGGQRPWSFLLISEVGLATRINMTSRSVRRTLPSKHKFTIEKYRGIELITVAVPGWKFSYGFIGRVGLLSTDKSLLEEAVDLYKDGEKGLAAMPGLKELVADPPGSDSSLRSRAGISFYIDVTKIRNSLSGRTQGSPLLPPLRTNAKTDLRPGEHKVRPYGLVSIVQRVAQHIDVWAGFGFRQHGNLRLDVRVRHKKDTRHETSDSRLETQDCLKSQVSSLESEVLILVSSSVPTNCLFFIRDETLGPDFLFDMLKAGARHAVPVYGPDLDVVRDGLLPVLRNGAAVAVLEPNIKELQLLPPVMAFFWVKDRAVAQAALEDLKGSLKIGRRKLEFTEIEHADIPINYTRLPIGMGMSIDAGYAFIGDDLLAIATDISALEAAIDVALSKRRSLMEDEHYTNVLPIVEASDGRIFMNIRSAAIMTKQAARLYAWRAKIAGESEAERIATMLYQNASTLEAWHYMGATFKSDGDETSVSLLVH